MSALLTSYRAFITEAEESAWWFKNRHVHGKQLLAAVKNGEVQVLTKQRLQRWIAASKEDVSSSNS
jgi:hypothetical protein